MLRTCNALRIASLPVLRNDGGGRSADTERTLRCYGCYGAPGRITLRGTNTVRGDRARTRRRLPYAMVQGLS
ncbi:MAG: hypothetical protein LBM98_02035 [Oscillospiraceae bacterium]|nr:hypothetical protein [Oscillospiraceae bacterium]